MAITIPDGAPTIFIRRAAYEDRRLSRGALDQLLGLTADEFRVEGTLVVIGPLSSQDSLSDLITELESNGLVYYEDFFEFTGNWPEWLRLFAAGR